MSDRSKRHAIMRAYKVPRALRGSNDSEVIRTIVQRKRERFYMQIIIPRLGACEQLFNKRMRERDWREFSGEVDRILRR